MTRRGILSSASHSYRKPPGLSSHGTNGRLSHLATTSSTDDAEAYRNVPQKSYFLQLYSDGQRRTLTGLPTLWTSGSDAGSKGRLFADNTHGVDAMRFHAATTGSSGNFAWAAAAMGHQRPVVTHTSITQETLSPLQAAAGTEDSHNPLSPPNTLPSMRGQLATATTGAQGTGSFPRILTPSRSMSRDTAARTSTTLAHRPAAPERRTTAERAAPWRLDSLASTMRSPTSLGTAHGPASGVDDASTAHSWPQKDMAATARLGSFTDSLDREETDV